MIRTLAAVIVLLVAIHLLAAAGGFVWLAASGRVDRERVGRLVDLFRPTIVEQKRLEEELQRNEQKALEAQLHLARMEDVADGPRSLEDRLAQKLQGDDFALHRLERMQEEGGAIQRRLGQDRAYIDAQLAKLQREREAFEAQKQAYQDQMADADFARAVETFEQLKARQAKQMFQEMLAAGQTELVVDYLAAMNLRKSAGVLKEFKAPEEIVQATMIVESLRRRGVDLMSPQLAQGVSP